MGHLTAAAAKGGRRVVREHLRGSVTVRGARATSDSMCCVHLGTSVIVACCFATISPRGWPPSICRLARRAQSYSRREVTDLPDAMNFAAPVKLFIGAKRVSNCYMQEKKGLVDLIVEPMSFNTIGNLGNSSTMKARLQ